MLKRSLLFAATTAALLSLATSAQAAFQVVGSIVANQNGETAAPTGISFTGNPISVMANPNPGVATDYNNANITYTGVADTPTTGTAFTVTEMFAITNTTTGQSGMLTATFNFLLTIQGGYGNLVLRSDTLTGKTFAGVTFGQVTLASPSITPTSTTGNSGKLSTTVLGANAAVPEPASLVLVGLGLGGLGLVRARRQSAR